MALFRRKPPEMSVSAITEFWTWWRDGGEAQMTIALASGDLGTVARQLSQRVKRIMPYLDWETGPGKTATHTLRLSAGGIPPLRVAVQRWLRAAPPANETWEFGGSRERLRLEDLNHVELDGFSFAPGRTRFSVDVDKTRDRVNVVAFNSVYPTLPPGGAMHFTSLALEWILGEDEVVRWIGSFEGSETPLEDAISASELREVISGVASVERSRSAISGTTASGNQMFIMVSRGMRWIDYPTFDLYNRITISYPESLRDDDGEPTGLAPKEAADRMGVLFRDLLRTVGNRGIVPVFWFAENNFVIHLYTDSEDQNVTQLVKTWAQSHPVDRIRQLRDPGWRELSRLLG